MAGEDVDRPCPLWVENSKGHGGCELHAMEGVSNEVCEGGGGAATDN